MRVGISIEEQGSSSGFKFESGNGEIVSCTVVNEKQGEYGSKCGFMVGIQRLNKDWKATDDEVVEEFLSCGPVDKFHPGNASNPDDAEPEDSGEEDGAEGNCIISVDGKKIDRKSKLSIFSKSLQELGFKPTLLNGYAPNIVGTKAYFDRLVLPKGDNYTGKTDPTALIAKEKIVEFPKGAGPSNAASIGKGKAAVATKATTPVAAAITALAPTTGGNEEVAEIALNILVAVNETAAGTVISRQKVLSKAVTYLAKNRVNPKNHKPVQDLIKNDAWFSEQAEGLGWSVEGTDVTVPAAA